MPRRTQPLDPFTAARKLTELRRDEKAAAEEAAEKARDRVRNRFAERARAIIDLCSDPDHMERLLAANPPAQQ